ncbi:MAG TPA: sugar phosphate isomerase/epimerase [Acidimicrobiales bacterium]|nr:sugar phosphate isomerase/epimerase [Acidimicrobiales bacterium]
MTGIAVQLYTLRQQVADLGLARVLERVAAIGYGGVELAGLGGLAPQEVRSIVADLGMVVSSAHVTLPVGADAQAVLDEQEAVGNTVLIAGGGPADVSSVEVAHQLADRFNEAAAHAAERGMTVGYHNHWWELDTPIDARRSPYELLLERLVPSVFMEVDIYWAQVGGCDPIQLVAALGPRARYLHVKDGPIEPRTPMTAVGAGRMDIAGVLAAATYAEWHVVELDEFGGDMFDAVAESYQWLADRA